MELGQIMMLCLSPGEFLSEGVAGTRQFCSEFVPRTGIFGESAMKSTFQTLHSNLVLVVVCMCAKLLALSTISNLLA